MLSVRSLLVVLSVVKSLQAVKVTAVNVDVGGLPPNLTGPLEENFLLTKAERYKINQLKGPDSFVTYRGHIYTGLADGRIVDISDCGVRTIAKLSEPGCVRGQQCSRPLGLRMDKAGRLIVADSIRGIFRVNVDTGEKELLYSSDSPVNGRRSRFINDVIVAADGTILFTDSSAKWSWKEFIYSLIEGEGTGRLLAYSDISNKSIVVVDNMAFPNGLEFGPGEEFLLISETSRARIRKLNLKMGKTWLELSNFAKNLPGLPDNIRASGRGTYWVAMTQARHENSMSLIDEYPDQPQMREMVALMSPMDQLVRMSEKYGMAVELDGNGQIIRSLQDPTGKRVPSITQITEYEGSLYLGSHNRPYVSRVPATETFHVERFLQNLRSTCRAKKMNLNSLRVLLKQLAAIAEFRRRMLEKKRQQEEEAGRATTTTTASPVTTSGSTGSPDVTPDVTTDGVTDSTTSSAIGSTTTQSVTSSATTTAEAPATTTSSGETGGGIETGETADSTTSTAAPTTSAAISTTTATVTDSSTIVTTSAAASTTSASVTSTGTSTGTTSGAGDSTTSATQSTT